MAISKAESEVSKAMLGDRLFLERLVNATDSVYTSGADVVSGLSQQPKTLPAKYFYDDRGSELFEQICQLPEYYLTRTETSILQACALDIAKITGPCELVELGSGSATKTRILLDAYTEMGYPLHYLPIDISTGILESSALDLLHDYPTLKVHGLVGTYELALERLSLPHLPTRTICFLGSTLGNLNNRECDLFFNRIASTLNKGEYFLLGVDLQKPIEILEAAYNDDRGVTAQFNLNMLRHLNHRFDGDFDLTQFNHQAFYNLSEHQIEMHLRSLKPQSVKLRSLDLTINFAPDETIRTEISRKFDTQKLTQTLENIGLARVKTWTDRNRWFGLLLMQMS
ncbi:L-histidine N(alpha)-methyltransferase [Pseudanabaena sp. PCC 6802]|uniref:L-histidine N(alpha)-methyltransferase n=1 Tax=Pseudanabaena sp. PCC 6802 TaxID=118173 RepID=UPI000344D6BD|nr:L-histidine N(alpha)-methyltransferase [Pseudanabaena sp. PCC 6802]